MDNINKIFVLGGTHGNEYTGAYIVNNWEKIFPKKSLMSDINIIPLLSNPKAFSEKTRYVDRDLNRSFLLKDLENINIFGYENERAKSINNFIGKKKSNSNFIIDTHTTNSQMGITLMTSSRDIYKLNLIKYISENIDNVNTIFTDDTNEDRPFLNSISNNSLLVEVGGVANNILDQSIFENTVDVIRLTIEYLNKLKSGSISLDESVTIPSFKIVKKVEFPKDDGGAIAGIIHKDIQGKDYIKEIDKSTNIFTLFDGTLIKFGEKNKYYMSFINESAYYEENIAFYLMRKINLTSSAIGFC